MARRHLYHSTEQNRSAIIEAAGRVYAAALARAPGTDQTAREEAKKAVDEFLDGLLEPADGA
jgi:hypothetical protein